MNKSDLITYIAQKAGLKKTDAEKALNATFEGIAGALKKGEKAAFVGFGSFSYIQRKAREGRKGEKDETI